MNMHTVFCDRPEKAYLICINYVATHIHIIMMRMHVLLCCVIAINYKILIMHAWLLK